MPAAIQNARSRIARSAAKWTALCFALALLAGCYTYVFLPGETSYEKISPPYTIQLMNGTGEAFSIEPSEYGKNKGFAVERVANGANFEVLMQVRRFRVGERDRTGAHHILDGPYLAQEGANTAVIRIRHRELYLLTIDLENERWFAPRTAGASTVLSLTVEIRDFEPRRWFRAGPH